MAENLLAPMLLSILNRCVATKEEAYRETVAATHETRMTRYEKGSVVFCARQSCACCKAVV